MIEHLVFLKVNNSNKIEEIIESLSNLKSKISNIFELSVGRNFCERNQGFQIGLRVLFKTKEDLDFYQKHPDHQEVLNNLIKPNLEDIIAIDYQVNS